MTDINSLRYVNKCDINGIRKLIHSSYDINDGEITRTTRPGIITIKNNSPFGKFLKNDDGYLHFYDDRVEWKQNDNDKQHSLSHEEFLEMEKNIEVMLAIKKDKSNDVVYIDAEDLFDLIDDDGNINDYNGITLDKTDVSNTLCALNEMSNKKVSKNDGDGKKASWYENNGYYSKICIGGNVPVFNEYDIQHNTRVGTKSINRYDQFILGYPAWPDYSKRGLEKRNVRLLEPLEYMAEIEKIIELQVNFIKSRDIKDLIVACPSDFLNSNALIAKGKNPNDYINNFRNAILNVAKKHPEINIHVSNYGKFFDSKLFSTENNILKNVNVPNNNVFMCKYNNTVLDAGNLQKLDKFSGSHINVALPINPHPQNGAGNGCLSTTGQQAFDENLARIMPTIPLLYNPDTNQKLNYVGNRVGILAETLTKNTAHKHNSKKVYMNRVFGDNVIMIDPDQTQQQLEQLAKQLDTFNTQYQTSTLKQYIKIDRKLKLVNFIERTKLKKIKFDKIKNYIESQHNNKPEFEPIQIISNLLSTGTISDGKTADLIGNANSNNKNLLNNNKLLEKVKKQTSQIKFLSDGKQGITKPFRGYGIQFSISKDKTQIFLKNNEFFDNYFDANLKSLVDGMIVEFPKDFDINNPKDANMFMMGKSNPFFVINHLKEKGCVFKYSNNKIIDDKDLDTIMENFNRLTELKKQVDKLDKIYIENKTANPKTKKNTNLEIICKTLIICATNENARKKFFGNKPLEMMNDINISVLNVVKENPDFFNSFDLDNVGNPFNLDKIKHQFHLAIRNVVGTHHSKTKLGGLLLEHLPH